MRNKAPCFCNALGTEDDPADDDKAEGDEHLQGFAPSGEKATFGDLVGVFAVCTKENEREEEDGVICSPRKECPIGTVPDAGYKEDDERIADDEFFLTCLRVLAVR